MRGDAREAPRPSQHTAGPRRPLSNNACVEGSREAPSGQGWAAFAATMVLIAGVFNFIYGLAAIVDDDYFVARELLFGDLSLWGWIHLILGVLQVVTAAMIFAGSELGAVLGITFAGFSAIAALLAIGAYPLWSVIILVVDGLIIYALTVYGDALKPS
jgi:hypothetical protein